MGSAVPTGLVVIGYISEFPAMNHWAKFIGPSKLQFVLYGLSMNGSRLLVKQI